MAEIGNILLFDGVCNLCNRLVIFIIKTDRSAKIKLAPLQSIAGQSLFKKYDLDADDIDSVVYICRDKFYIRSSAILHVLKEIGGVWSLFYGFIIIPRFIRDLFYNLLAKNRYRIFGRRDSCMIPGPDLNKRFLQ